MADKPLNHMKEDELRQLAEQEGVEVTEEMSRNEVMAAISSARQDREDAEGSDSQESSEGQEPARISPDSVHQAEDVPASNSGMNSTQTVRANATVQSPAVQRRRAMPDPNFSEEEDSERKRTRKRSKQEIEREAQTEEAELRRALMSESKVRFAIPLYPGEKPGATHSVRINGVVFVYKKGVMYDMPESVANLLADSYNITMDAGRDMELGRSQDVETALS